MEGVRNRKIKIVEGVEHRDAGIDEDERIAAE